MNAADMRGTLSVVGYHLDVISLAKASMVCRIWYAAFGVHPKWKEFYENSKESLQDPFDKKGAWRVLYGGLFDKYKSFRHNKWTVEHHLPWEVAPHLTERCQGSFLVDDKLVILADESLFMLKSQLKAKNMLSLVDVDPNIQKSPYIRLVPRKNDQDKKVEIIRKTLLDKRYLYASTNDGQLLRWEKSRFPSGCICIKEGVEIHDFKIQNEILYILKSSNDPRYGDSKPPLLYAFKDSEELWCLELPQGADSDIMVNKYIGIILEKVEGECLLNLISPKELYLWDTQKVDKPKRVGMGWNHILMNDEVIYSTQKAVMGCSLKGSRVIYELNELVINTIIADYDQNLIYLISKFEDITTFSLSENKVISRINVGFRISEPAQVKLFNGILFYVDDQGRLILIEPTIDIIKKGPENMFDRQIEVHNGRVHGLSPNRDRVVIVRADESKTILEKIKSLAGKIRKPK